MSVIDEYLKGVSPDKKPQLEKIRQIGYKVVPDAQDTISYGMPALTYKGKAFLGFDLHKNHIGIYPFGGEEIEAFKDKIEKLGYGHTKGAIQVGFDSEINEELLKEIIEHRIKRIIDNKVR